MHSGFVVVCSFTIRTLWRRKYPDSPRSNMSQLLWVWIEFFITLSHMSWAQVKNYNLHCCLRQVWSLGCINYFWWGLTQVERFASFKEPSFWIGCLGWPGRMMNGTHKCWHQKCNGPDYTEIMIWSTHIPQRIMPSVIHIGDTTVTKLVWMDKVYHFMTFQTGGSHHIIQSGCCKHCQCIHILFHLNPFQSCSSLLVVVSIKIQWWWCLFTVGLVGLLCIIRTLPWHVLWLKWWKRGAVLVVSGSGGRWVCMDYLI